TIGLPGGSQAFAIAERLGLPAGIVADARSRLSETQQAFETTLASIRETQEETSEALDRARRAEARAAEAMRQAEEERRRARRERDEATRAARAEAERLVDQLRDEVRETRRALERQTVTAPSLDQSIARAEEHLGRLPEPERREETPVVAAPVAWRLGDRARSRSQGWEGRLTALERNGQRATLDAGGLRVTVPIEDLEPLAALPEPPRPTGRAAEYGAGSGTAAAIRLDRVRSVASSLDLRGARVDEALELLGRYLEDASLAGLEKVLIIHGLGTGALRDAVRAEASAHPLVKSARAGERGEGGDGATIVTL
ncbi:MAG: hypothetical protein FJ038_04810, partial [Chloroflexi bacterium]|nr:hypothetical protein [Chloroflexota bacterium]